MDLFKRLMLPISMLVLAIGFWRYPNFEKIAAGIAVFLFGLKLLEKGVQGFSGGFMEKMLQRVTRSTPRAVLFGVAGSTAVQSSTIILVLSISFISAGMIPLLAGLGVVVGANIGTTTGSWLIASFGLSISLSKFAMPLMIFGVLLLFQPSTVRQGIGQFLLGMGFLFLGIDYIKEGFTQIRFDFDLNALAPNIIVGVLLFVLIGFIMTVIMQSSHATLLLTLSALASGHISFELATALTMGACVGTTIIPLISSLGANAAGRRLALTHFIFNAATLLMVLPWLTIIIWLINFMSDLLHIGAEYHTLKLAFFHTSFSLIGAAIMLPSKEKLENWLLKIIPEKESSEEKPKYLTQSALESVATAITVARSETFHLYKLGVQSIVEGLGWELEEFLSDKPLDELKSSNRNIPFNMRESYQLRIKGIYSELIGFISLARGKAHDHQDDQLRELWAANYHLVEAIKGVKHLQRNMKQYLHHANSDMSASYKDMRTQIGELIRVLEKTRHTDDPIESRLAIDHQMLVNDRNRDETNALVANLIRTRKVTTTMATSLMTDKGYVYDICHGLIALGRLLFIDDQRTQAQTQTTLDLESSDLNAINQRVDEQLTDFIEEDDRR